MSWLFGYRKPVSDVPAQGAGGTGDNLPPSGNDKPSSGITDSRATAGRESVYKFDSTALERAAQAAKELERSRMSHHSLSLSLSISLSFLEYASQAFDVVRMQEQTKQLEIQKQMKVNIDEQKNQSSCTVLSLFLLRNMLKLNKKCAFDINNN